jgi:hypothetical protein
VTERPFNPTQTEAVGPLGLVWFGLLPLRSPLLGESVSSPRPTEMFQFGRCPPHRYGFTVWSHPLPGEGLPHSEIAGSPRGVHSPALIAATHVLHRHATPRHPPHAPSSFFCRSLVSKTPGDSRLRVPPAVLCAAGPPHHQHAATRWGSAPAPRVCRLVAPGSSPGTRGLVVLSLQLGRYRVHRLS